MYWQRIVWVWGYGIYCLFLFSHTMHALAEHEEKQEHESDDSIIEQSEYQSKKDASEIFSQEPAWYYTLSPTSKKQIIGYGSGNSQEIAEAQALADITNALTVIVERNVQDKAIIESDGTVVEQTTVVNSISQSNAVLQNTSILRREKIGNTIFVAMVYDTSTLGSRLLTANVVHDFSKHDISMLASSNIKTKLPFYQLLVSLGIKSNFQLGYKNESWYVHMGDAQVWLNDKEFADNFIGTVYSSSYNPYAIEVLVVDNNQLAYLENTKDRVLRENQYFVLRYTPQIKESSVYVSLFYVHSFGAVQSFVVNTLVSHRESIIYPETGVVNVLLPHGRASNNRKDMILAVESKEAHAVFNDFYPVNNNAGIVQDSLLYSYGTLLESIQNSQYVSRILWVGK